MTTEHTIQKFHDPLSFIDSGFHSNSSHPNSVRLFINTSVTLFIQISTWTHTVSTADPISWCGINRDLTHKHVLQTHGYHPSNLNQLTTKSLEGTNQINWWARKKINEDFELMTISVWKRDWFHKILLFEPNLMKNKSSTNICFIFPSTFVASKHTKFHFTSGSATKLSVCWETQYLTHLSRHIFVLQSSIQIEILWISLTIWSQLSVSKMNPLS